MDGTVARLYWQGTSKEEAFPPYSVHGYRVLPWPGLALAPHIRFQPSAGCVQPTHARSILSIPRTYAAFLLRLPFPCVPRFEYRMYTLSCACFSKFFAAAMSGFRIDCRLRTWKLVELLFLSVLFAFGRYFFVIKRLWRCKR